MGYFYISPTARQGKNSLLSSSKLTYTFDVLHTKTEFYLLPEEYVEHH